MALRHSVLWLLASLAVTMTLGDLYFSCRASAPGSTRVGVVLGFMIAWLSLPSLGVCAWVMHRRLGANADAD